MAAFQADHAEEKLTSPLLAFSNETWDELIPHLPAAEQVRRDELTLGYRAPGQILEFASRLLPSSAPSVRPTSSVREGRFSLVSLPDLFEQLHLGPRHHPRVRRFGRLVVDLRLAPRWGQIRRAQRR